MRAAITVTFGLALLAACATEPGPVDEDSSELTACSGATVEGVDISGAQGAIDWTAVRGAGVEWAAIKATQGTYNTQSTFAANWQHARAAGVIRGAYHFFDPTEDGAAQARHFLEVVGPLAEDDLPPLLDLECPDGNARCLGFTGGTGKAPAAAIRQRVLDFMTTVEQATGKRPVIYTFNAYFSSNGVATAGFERWPLWIAYPVDGGCFRFPPPWTEARFWQWSWSGSVPGIAGKVDRDRFLGTRAELLAFARGGAIGATHFEFGGSWLSGFGAPDVALVGDFDGDRRDDLAWYEHWNAGTITVARSDGHAFQPAGSWLTGFGTPDWAGAGDFDGDGKADLAWYEAWNGGSITVALSTGTRFRAAGKWLTGFGRPDRVVVGDFDGDGKADLAWYEAWNDHAITVIRSTGSAFASTGKWITGVAAPSWAAAADFDGDRRADLAWLDAQGALHVLRSTGTALADTGAWASGLGVPDQAFAGDLDGDRRADVAWYRGNTVEALRSTGSGFAPPATFVGGLGAPDWAGIGDFDGDGRRDLAWYEHWNAASVSVELAR
jgi:lysozyme